MCATSAGSVFLVAIFIIHSVLIPGKELRACWFRSACSGCDPSPSLNEKYDLKLKACLKKMVQRFTIKCVIEPSATPKTEMNAKYEKMDNL